MEANDTQSVATNNQAQIWELSGHGSVNTEDACQKFAHIGDS